MCILAATALLSPAVAMSGPDLSGTVSIIDERFQGELNRFDGQKGLWSTIPRRGQLMTNAAETVFLSHGVLGSQVDAQLPSTHSITEEGLALRTVRMPDEILPIVRDYMRRTGQGNRADRVLYAAGEITTAHTWSQTYGYFEIEAKIPQGKGRWPAFWLTFAGIGWPPEIDVFEAYGKGIAKPTKKDDTFNAAVLFDARDAEGRNAHNVQIQNDFAPKGEPVEPNVKKRGDRNVYTFVRHMNAAKMLDADIYNEFHTYAALWTPETITYYFGKDRDSLQEIYRTPTPEDANDPMFAIANDQFTMRGGHWSPDKNMIEQVIDPENAYRIKHIEIRAFKPTVELRMTNGDSVFDAGDSVIWDTPEDDEIYPGQGFDIIHLSGGGDRIYMRRDRQNKIIHGFGSDDHVVLEGYPFVDTRDVMARLTQVNGDVWLPSGGDPGWPHTLIFRDTQVSDFRRGQFTVSWPLPKDIWLAQAGRRNRPSVDSDNDGFIVATEHGAWLNDRSRPVKMTGSAGTDRFVISNRNSEIFERPDGGLDTLITWTDFQLPRTVEHGIAKGEGVTLQGSSGHDRLEAQAEKVDLVGGAGDDLYVIAPDAVSATIRIASGDGHDRLRGFGQGHRLAIDGRLQLKRGEWSVKQAPDGILVDFGSNQTLLIENVTLAETERLLGLR
jgi:hypothetical protein